MLLTLIFTFYSKGKYESKLERQERYKMAKIWVISMKDGGSNTLVKIMREFALDELFPNKKGLLVESRQ